MYYISIAPLVSAVVLNYRSPQDTVQCVNALLLQKLESEIEIIVVDNHSDDESVGIFRAKWREEPRVRIMESGRNVGFARGNAIGTPVASGKFLLFCNPDNTLPETTLQELTEILAKQEDIGIVAPTLVYPDGTIRPSARNFPTVRELFMKRIASKAWHEKHRKSPSMHDQASLHDVDWVAGGCFVIRRETFEKLNGFDPQFFLFFEDIDLCRRCWQAGKRVVLAPGIRASDKPRRLSEGGLFTLLFKKTGRIHVRSGFKYFRKWPQASAERKNAG